MHHTPLSLSLLFHISQRMFKRLLDPKAEKRPVSVLEANKYLEDRWLAKLGVEKAMNGRLVRYRRRYDTRHLLQFLNDTPFYIRRRRRRAGRALSVYVQLP